MKTVKSLLLAGAAAIVASSAVQAADLPAAEPVEYVRICDAYGAGFFFIPGTDTCLKISGLVRLDVSYVSNNYTPGGLGGVFGTTPGALVMNHATNKAPNSIITPSFNFAGVPAVPVGALSFANNGVSPATTIPAGTWAFGASPIYDQLSMGIRALLRFDARSRTDWGVLRAFFEFNAGSDNSAQNGVGLVVRYGFVQFGLGGGVVTAGLTDSFANGFSSSILGTAFGDPGQRAPLLAYSANFGNGIVGTISLEDSEAKVGTGGTTGLLAFGGTNNGEAWVRRSVQLPDLVGNLTVTQAWGTAYIMAAVAQYRFINTACSVNPLGFCGASTTGWAVGGGVRVNLPMLAPGSNVWLKANYADGALHYLGNVQNASVFGTSLTPAGLAVVGSDTTINKLKGFSIYGGFQHFFTPALRASIMAGYASVNGFGNGTVGATAITFRSGYGVHGNIVWSPVNNLDLGVELFYQRASYNAFNGTLGLASGNVARASDSGWGAVFRVQRNF